MLQLRTVLMRLFGYPYKDDLVMCKDSPDYLPEIEHLPCSERLQILKLPTIAYRRARGDMIEVFK